jgi:hypothetical protein
MILVSFTDIPSCLVSAVSMAQLWLSGVNQHFNFWHDVVSDMLSFDSALSTTSLSQGNVGNCSRMFYSIIPSGRTCFYPSLYPFIIPPSIPHLSLLKSSTQPSNNVRWSNYYQEINLTQLFNCKCLEAGETVIHFLLTLPCTVHVQYSIVKYKYSSDTWF